MSELQTYIAFLRGINVGGHHKVPMAELRKEMEQMGFKRVTTLLNSGNVIFEGNTDNESKLEKKIAPQLEETFGFPIPVMLRNAKDVLELLDAEPFQDINTPKNIRLYTSFVKEEPEQKLKIPWVSKDQSFHIIRVHDKTVCSVLDISVTKTPKAMAILEQYFGKDITTRNWNTMLRIKKKLA